MPARCNCGCFFVSSRSFGQHVRWHPGHAAAFDNNEPPPQETVTANVESSTSNTDRAASIPVHSVIFDGSCSANGTIHAGPSSSRADDSSSEEFPDLDPPEDNLDVSNSDHAPANNSELGGNDSDSSTHSSDPPDSYLVDKFNEYASSGYGNMVNSKQYESDVKLMGILKKANAPNYLFDEVKKWARASILDKVSFIDKNSKCRAAVLTEMRRRFDTDRVQPQSTDHILPRSAARSNQS